MATGLSEVTQLRCCAHFPVLNTASRQADAIITQFDIHHFENVCYSFIADLYFKYDEAFY